MRRAPPDAAGGAPWLSVLVPAFDASAHIEAMLHSVLAPHSPGIEVVVVDDASPDDTAARVARIAARDERLRLLHNDVNRGVAATRQRLLAEARGTYVWFIDADDLLRRGALPRLEALLRDDPVDLVLCDFRVHARAPWRRRRRSTFHGPSRGDDAGVLLAGALEAGQLHVWSKIARATVWRSIAFPPRARYEDMPAVAQLLAGTGRWRHVAQPWLRYRERSGSLSRAMPVESALDHSLALDDVERILRPRAAGSPRADVALDYALLRGHAAIARRLARAPDAPAAVMARCRDAFHARFPDAGATVLARCRRRGWWLRAARIAHALDRAGWRALKTP